VCLKRESAEYAWSHDDKAQLLEQHFLKIVGTKEHRRATMNWDELDRPHLTGLHHLDDMFSDEEIRRTIVEIAPEKSPGPDGFTGIFYRVC
jgi:hypothetical protein